MSTETSPDLNIATATKTATDFELTPPDPVPDVAPEKAAGLVPVSDEQKSKLETKVDAFVTDLVSVDANSPAFGEKVDQITRMGQEQIRAAAAQSNRFLDRPVRAMDADSTVGKDLAELRRTVEELDPGRKEKLLTPRKLFGIIPFGNKLKNYFDSYTSFAGSHSGASSNESRKRQEGTPSSITPRSTPNARSFGKRWASWSR